MWCILFCGIFVTHAVNFNPMKSCDERRERIDGKVRIYCCVNCMKVRESDIILGGSCCRKSSNDTSHSSSESDDIDGDERRRLSPAQTNIWPNAYIPYEIHPDINHWSSVPNAIAHVNSYTSIQLAPRNGESQYILFKSSGNPYSSYTYVGRSSSGASTIWLGSAQGTGTVIHEIGHRLGLHHTHSREDRDLYIRINWDIIWRPHWSDYLQVDDIADDCGEYDYNSIMHYSGYGELEAINPPGHSLGGSVLSHKDIRCINWLYRNEAAKKGFISIDDREGDDYQTKLCIVDSSNAIQYLSGIVCIIIAVVIFAICLSKQLINKNRKYEAIVTHDL